MSALAALLAGCDSPPSSRQDEQPSKAAPSVQAPVAPAPKAEGSGQQPVQEASHPVTGDRIILALLGEPSNLIPPLSTDAASKEVADLIYVAPLKYDKDLNVALEAAESFETLEDGRLLRFKLREDVRWTDGKPLTAADVEFTYRLMIDPKTPTAYAEDYKNISAFTVTGPYSFEVRYEQPFARAVITWMHKILPKHALEGQDLLATKLLREPLGAGPYALKEWVPGQKLVLAANQDYFEGRPYLDEVVYRVIPDTATQFLELKAGNLDSMALTPQQHVFQTGGSDWEASFRKYKYLAFSYAYLGWNMREPLFQDVRVRRALAHAVDKAEVVQGALLGLGQPTIGPYKPGSWMYNAAIRDYEFSPDKARELLAEAGWTQKNADGVLVKDGKAFSFTILTNQGNEQRIKTATIIQNRLKQVGVDVKIRVLEWASFIKEFVHPGKFEAVLLGWNVLQDPDLYDVWHSSKALPGGLNHTAFIHPEVDELLEKGRRTIDREERKRIYDRFQEVLHAEQPYLFLYAPMALPVVQARIQNVEVAPAGITHNFIRWWVPKDQQRMTR